ncbi:MAG: segregation and condensation protein A [Lutispora sp.]|jgi:segregation and condensation protein A|uniref:segregation and condensation protein A n=1 Tax=Lutispora sp. TaxID=2828727 RepID=UPI0035691739
MSINIKLEVFEGPFELLFHLIEKAKVDIYDIPIADITDQYINYLKMMQSLDIDLASEFLVMAATLLEIKSKMLLPKAPKNDEIEDSDPREELVKKLLEYKAFKELSFVLKEKLSINEKALCKDSNLADEIIDSFTLPDKLSIEILLEKFQMLMKKRESFNNRGFGKIYRDNITVEDKITQILKILSSARVLYFDDLILDCINKLEAILTFLAVLELIKRRKIYVEQSSNFDKIIVRRR